MKVSHPSLIPSALKVLPEPLVLFLRPGVGRAHKRQCGECLYFNAKNPIWMYKAPVSGYTINRKNNRQQKNLKNRQQKIHIELFPERPKPPWTQNFLRPQNL